MCRVLAQALLAGTSAALRCAGQRAPGDLCLSLLIALPRCPPPPIRGHQVAGRPPGHAHLHPSVAPPLSASPTPPPPQGHEYVIAPRIDVQRCFVYDMDDEPFLAGSPGSEDGSKALLRALPDLTGWAFQGKSDDLPGAEAELWQYEERCALRRAVHATGGQGQQRVPGALGGGAPAPAPVPGAAGCMGAMRAGNAIVVRPPAGTRASS